MDVTVINLDTANLAQHWQLVTRSMAAATFIAVDAELSGIGPRRDLVLRDLPARYSALRSVAQSRSLLSLGISCFQLLPTASPTYAVITFDVLLLRDSPYVVEPRSLRFLTEHGFDFNRQASLGLSYRSGDPRAPASGTGKARSKMATPSRTGTTTPAATSSARDAKRRRTETGSQGTAAATTPATAATTDGGRGTEHEAGPAASSPRTPAAGRPVEGVAQEPSARALFAHLLRSGKPVVLHNALIDLCFLYEGLYCALPPKLDTFVADLAELFTGGVIDTKVVAEYRDRLSSSFLEYVFRRAQWLNHERRSKGAGHHASFVFPRVPGVETRAIPVSSVNPEPQTAAPICERYSGHGHCQAGAACGKSHDLDAILLHDLTPKKRRKRRADGTGAGDGTAATATATATATAATTEAAAGAAAAAPLHHQASQGHRAGFDAFMTGYYFALSAAPEQRGFSHIKAALDRKLAGCRGHVHLGAKPNPLLIRKSSYTTTSPGHRAYQSRLRGGPDVSMGQQA